MPNVAAVLKEEIQRLARKEAKSQLTPLKKAVAAERRTNAALRRELSTQRRLIASLASAVKRGSAAAARVNSVQAPVSATGEKWRKDTVRSTRRKLDLTQAKFAKLLGVSQITISFWETGRTTPRAKQQAKVMAARALSRDAAHSRLGISGGATRRGRAKKA